MVDHYYYYYYYVIKVLSDETFAEHAASLAELFKYKGLTLKSSSKYSGK